MGTRAGALKAWRRPGHRQVIARAMKARYKPRMKRLPSEVKQFMRVLHAADIDIVDITTPHRVITGRELAVFCNDPKNGRELLADRYLQYAHRVGLEMYEFISNPLPGGGISAALIVGPPRGK